MSPPPLQPGVTPERDRGMSRSRKGVFQMSHQAVSTAETDCENELSVLRNLYAKSFSLEADRNMSHPGERDTFERDILASRSVGRSAGRSRIAPSYSKGQPSVAIISNLGLLI